MTPKKNGSIDVAVAAIIVIICLFTGWCLGTAIYDKEMLVGETAEVDGFAFIMERLEYRLEHPFENFESCIQSEAVLQSLLGGLFVGVLIIAYIDSTKRNLITGKTYGSARWGTRADIQDLFADTLKAEEIKKAKALRWPWGRWTEKSRVKAECREMVESLKRLELSELEKKAHALRQSREFNKAEYKRERKLIFSTADERYENLFAAMWEPLKIERTYQEEVAQIRANRAQGISLTDDTAMHTALKAAKKRRKEALRDFWSVPRRIAKINKKYENAEAILTETERICLHNYKVNNHVLIIGGSGAGKTRGFLLPNILNTAGTCSFVITDPKGEILEKTLYFLSKIKGYKVRVLNLDDKQASDGYNPFAYIHPDRPGYEERVIDLIETIIVNTDGGEKKEGGDPFWPKAERLFLQAMFFFVCDAYVEEEQNIETVLDLIAKLEIEEENDRRDSDLDYFARIFEETLNEADTENHNAGTKNLGVKTYKQFRSKASGKTAKSIVISAVARLNVFSAPEISRIMSYDSMELDRLGEELMAIFVVVPPTTDTYNCVAGCLFTQMFQELQYCAAQVHKHDGQRLPVPVRFLLDEFKNTCNIPNFLKILAYARSFGVGIVPILQTTEQLKEMFKDEWGSVVDNCSCTLFLGSISHPDALEYISKMTGKATYDKRSTSRSKGRQGSYSWSYDEVGRELMTVDDLRTLDKEQCMLFVAGRPPFYSKKFDYTKHPNYRMTSDGNKALSLDYVPVAPNTGDREAEKSTHDAYLQQRVLERMENTLAQMNESVSFIEVGADARKLLTHVSRVFNHLTVVSNDVLDAAGDTPTQEQLDEILAFTEDAEQEDIISAVAQRVDETKEAVESEIAENGIVVSGPEDAEQMLLEAGENIVPVSAALLGTQIEISEENEEILIDEDGETAEAEEVGDLSSELQALLDEPEEMY